MILVYVYNITVNLYHSRLLSMYSWQLNYVNYVKKNSYNHTLIDLYTVYTY